MSVEEIANKVREGEQVLVRCASVPMRVRLMLDLYDHGKGDLQRQRSSNMIRHPSGGFAHFVIEDREVMGMEYHDASGPLTGVMATRVRL